jgi:hypothetical protein
MNRDLGFPGYRVWFGLVWIQGVGMFVFWSFGVFVGTGVYALLALIMGLISDRLNTYVMSNRSWSLENYLHHPVGE